MSDFDRIYLEPDHAQIEGRMWCVDDDPASLGEPWTEYVRADLYATLEAERDGYREAFKAFPVPGRPGAPHWIERVIMWWNESARRTLEGPE